MEKHHQSGGRFLREPSGRRRSLAPLWITLAVVLVVAQFRNRGSNKSDDDQRNAEYDQLIQNVLNSNNKVHRYFRKILSQNDTEGGTYQ